MAAFGIASGISPAFYGYFEMTTWGPIALLVMAFWIGLLLAGPALPHRLAAVAAAGLALFAAWSLLSMGWAESADHALVEGDRWVLYAIFLLVMVTLVRDQRDGQVFLGSMVAGVLGVALYDLVRMFGDEGPSLFGGSRLQEPLGYVNGLGGFFLLGFWPLAAVAERCRNPALAGLSAAAATLLAGLVLLTESRGTVLALAVSAVVVLAMLPGRNRRAWLLLAVLAAIAAAWTPLTDVTQGGANDGLLPSQDAVQRAAETILLTSAIAGLVWGSASWMLSTLGRQSGQPSIWLPRISTAALCAVATLALASAAVAVDDPAGKVSDQYEEFTELDDSTTGSRFTSGGGNRYDYWRIAWEQFTDNPVRGIGAGNFTRTYFLERRTNEDVRQAHSLELGTLGDTGLVGGLALGAFLAAVFVGLWRRAVAARRGGAEVGLTVAAAGTFIVWLVQTSVDWLHLIPGLTAIAIGGAAILLLPPTAGRGANRGLTPAPPLAIGALLIVTVAAIVLVGRPTLAEQLREEARDELSSRPLSAIETAEESLSLNPEAVPTYYVKAAAQARHGGYRPARATLLEAIRREPHNYVSWALLGDLATRRGDLGAARRAYGRASDLNPRDRALAQLARRRGLLERLHREPEAAPALFEAAQ